MALYSYQLLTHVLPGQPYGDGVDGVYSSATIPTMLPDSCSGTSSSTTLTTSAATFANGDILKVWQVRGTGAGQWEIVKVASGGGTSTLTLTKPLNYTYTDSGASQAQAIKIPRYSSVTVSSGTWTVPAWDQNKNGELIFACQTTLTPTGTVSATAKGFRGGDGGKRDVGNAASGESYDTDKVSGGTSIGNYAAAHAGAGGSGGEYKLGSGHGGGGAHASAGGGSRPGSTYGTSDLSSIFLGSGGGGGYEDGSGATGGAGASGGGSITIYARTITSPTSIVANGDNGQDVSSYDGGSGAGGSILICSFAPNIGTDKLSVVGGSTGSGGAGGKGRIAIYYATSLSGSVSSTYYGSLTSEKDIRLLYPVRRGMLI